MANSPTIVSETASTPTAIEKMRRAPVHPGPVFREQFREPLKISQRQAALRLGISVNYLNQIELEKSPVSADVAVRLSALTRVSAEFWMRLQSHHDLWHAIQEAKKRNRVIPGLSFAAEVRAFRKNESLRETGSPRPDSTGS